MVVTVTFMGDFARITSPKDLQRELFRKTHSNNVTSEPSAVDKLEHIPSNMENVHNTEMLQIGALIPQNHQSLQSTQDNITSEDLQQFINLNTDVQV